MPDIKATILARFREAGGDMDRWDWTDARLMADGLSNAEDIIEIAARGRMTEERRELRTARRRLENAIPDRHN